MIESQARGADGFVPDTHVHREPTTTQGPLSGLRFAVKDLFDVRGHASSCGHPEWKRTHPPAEDDAPALRRLLDAGAELVGVTLMDELAYSLAGENPHYGTPHNPVDEERVCGGSSCGSACVTAAGAVDFALGTDTGGSIRVPASFCSLYGMRPSHGLISLEGVMPLAPSFDTVGWFARDAAILQRVGQVLLGEPDGRGAGPRRLLLAEDAFELLEEAPRARQLAAVQHTCQKLGLAEEPLRISAEGLDTWYATFRRLQAREIWQALGDWVRHYRPAFGPDVRERFATAEARAQKGDSLEEEQTLRERVRSHLYSLLPEGTLLLLPAAPGPAPHRGADPEALGTFRNHAMQLTCPAGLAGLPQVSLPLSDVDGLPLGLSLVAGPGQDAALLQVARTLCAAP